MLASHDAHPIDLAADRLGLVAGGACRPFDGDLDDCCARRRKRLADVAAAIATEEQRWLETHAAMDDAAE